MDRFSETMRVFAIISVFTVMALPALSQVTHEDFKILPDDVDSEDSFSHRFLYQ